MTFHAYPSRKKRGSKRGRQADNKPVLGKQAGILLGQKERRQRKNSTRVEKSCVPQKAEILAVSLVREVGFEPTNPYGTGASGLRFQDPIMEGLFDLAWQLPQHKGPAVLPADRKALIGFPPKIPAKT